MDTISKHPVAFVMLPRKPTVEMLKAATTAAGISAAAAYAAFAAMVAVIDAQHEGGRRVGSPNRAESFGVRREDRQGVGGESPR